MNKFAALLILVFAASRAEAGAGTTALPFLKIDSGARAAAMAGAYCATGDDALAVFYNPAGAALAKQGEVSLGHNEWLQGIRNETAVYLQPLDKRTSVFAAVNALFSGSMDKYDRTGTETGTFSSMEAAASFGVATRLTPDLYAGGAMKALYQGADGKSAMAWAADGGILKTYERWRFGASVSNLGTKMKLGSTAFSLPLMLRAGLSNDVADFARISADVVKAGESEVALAAGIEKELTLSPRGAFYLRGGLKTGSSRYAGSGITAGIGLRGGDMRIDYAYAPYGELGDAHRVTIAFAFGPSRNDAKEKRTYKTEAPQRTERPGVKKVQTAPRRGKKAGGSKAEDPVYFIW